MYRVIISIIVFKIFNGVITLNGWWMQVWVLVFCIPVILIAWGFLRRRRHWTAFRIYIWPPGGFIAKRLEFFSTWRDELGTLDDHDLAIRASRACERELSFWFKVEGAGLGTMLNLLPKGALPQNVEEGLRVIGKQRGAVGHDAHGAIADRRQFIAALEVVTAHWIERLEERMNRYEASVVFLMQGKEALLQLSDLSLAARGCSAVEDVLPVHFSLLSSENIGPLIKQLKRGYGPELGKNIFFSRFISALEYLSHERGNLVHDKTAAIDSLSSRVLFVKYLQGIAYSLNEENTKAINGAYEVWYPGFLGGFRAMPRIAMVIAFLGILLPVQHGMEEFYKSRHSYVPQIAKEANTPVAKNKNQGKVSRGNRKIAEPKVDAALAADIEEAKPFISNVLEKIRCKPDDFWKQNALFESVAAPGINPNGWIGPWTGFTFPDGTCMTPVATFGWRREHNKRSGAQLSVQVRWRSSEAVVRKQTIELRKIPDLGWRVTTMVSGR